MTLKEVVFMSKARELCSRICAMMLEPGYYAEKRERRRRKNDAFMAMMEKKLAREQQKGAFRHFEAVGNSLRSSSRKVVH